MADLGEVNKISGVFGGVEFDNNEQQLEQNIDAGTIRNDNLPVPENQTFWGRFKSFWLQEIDWNREIKVELTPYQQKIEDELNDFLHQEITWQKVHDFLFKEITFGKKKNNE